MRFFNIILFSFVVFFMVAPTVKAAVQLEASQGQTQFLALGKPAMIRISGHGAGPTGNFTFDKNTVTGSMTVDMSTMTTEIEMRDHHMKEKYLEVGKYKNAILELKALNITADDKSFWSTAEKPLQSDTNFEGTLDLHGVKKPVTGTFKVLSGQGDARSIEAHFKINLSDFKIEIPTYAGIKVADSVEVTVTSTLKTKK